MDFSFLGDGFTTDLFWDCECERNYIHSKTVYGCINCGAMQEDQPDSMVEEVIQTLQTRGN